MSDELMRQLLLGGATIGLPLILLAAVLIYSVRAQRRVKAQWQQAQAEDPVLAEYTKLEGRIKPGRDWYTVPVLILVMGWTVGIASMNYISEQAGLGMAVGAGVLAFLLAALISFLRGRARRQLAGGTTYQKWGGMRLGLAAFVVIFLANLILVIMSSPRGREWVASGFRLAPDGGQAANANRKAAADVGAGQLPADLPKDVPLYPGATAISLAPSGGVKMLTMQTRDAPAEVAGYYQRELKSNGWKVTATRDKGDKTVVQASKGKRQCTVGIKGAGAQTAISITDTGQ